MDPSSEHLNSEDVKAINETFDLIKNLNKELEAMGKVKTKIESDISQINKKIDSVQVLEEKKEEKGLRVVEQNTYPLMKEQLISTLKQDLLQELTPLFKRFDMKNFQEKLSEELNSILEREASKLRSEFEHKNQDARKDVSKKLSELESRLLSSLQHSDSFKKSFSSVKGGDVKELVGEVEKKIHESIEKNNKKFFTLFSSSVEEMDTLKGVVKGYGKELEAAFDELIKLDRENKELKKSIEVLEKTHSKDFQKELSLALDEKKKELEKEHKRIEKDHDEKFQQLDEYFEALRKRISEHEKSFESRGKEELRSLEKHFKETLDLADTKIEELKELNEKQEEYIVTKINEIIDNVNLFEEKNESELKKLKESLKEEFSDVFKVELKKAKESLDEFLAKELIKLNETKTKQEIETKEFRKKLSESIDEKLLNSQKQFDLEFKELLKDISSQVKEKEEDYVEKLLIVEEEKKATLKELKELKVEVQKEVEIELNKLDKVLEKFDLNVEDLSQKKEKLLEELDVDLEEKKNSFANFAIKLSEEREENENAFREVFSKKVQTLQEHIDTRLDSLDAKFLEKQHKVFDEKIKEELKVVQLLREQLESRASEIDSKMKLIEGKVDAFFANLSNEGKDLNHKVESRVTHLEKQLNKRFLDYDSDFSNFKSIVIDEVEDLMREINSVLQNKTEYLDTQMQRLGVEKSEALSKTQMASSMQGVIQKELQSLRDEMSELRMKTQENNTSQQSLNSTVSSMLQYENSLMNLIRSLKERGVERENIKELLINKGHPRVYVTVLLDNFEALLKH